ncbi:MAG: AI-2E family transporter [Rhodospirillales bacterium]|nr:AI-2E family transporter [Rhodospirillales bacterium]
MSREQRILIWLTALFAAGLLLHFLSDVLLPFIVGITIAYFFDPLADRLERMGMSRTIATALILLGFFIIAIGIVILIFPLLQNQIVTAIKLVPVLIDHMQEFLKPLMAQMRADFSTDTMNELKQAAGNYAGTVFKWISGFIAQIWSGGLAVLNLLSLILIMPLVAFYLLRDWDLTVKKVDGWLPRHSADTIREQVRKIDETLAGFVRGQASVCLVLAVVYAVGLTLAGLKAGLLIGIAAGALAVIPYIGAAVSFIIGVGLAIAQFHQDWVSILIVAGVFILGQTLESYFLTPKLVGGRVGLSPIWIIFAMLAGGSLYGLSGVLIALPVAAVSGVLVRFALAQYLESDLYHGTSKKPSAEK